MKKLLLLVLGGSTLISVVLLFAFRSWVGKVNETMPAEGKAIFSRIDPAACSAQKCAACEPDVCESHGCKIFEYSWVNEGQSYTRHYCDAVAPATPAPAAR